MIHNGTKFLALTAFVFSTFFLGIIRHDVDENEYLALAAEKQFDCVGQIFNETLATGSCVLISDRFVLSAAHVFIDSDTRPDTMEFNGQTIIIYEQFNHRVTDVTNLYLIFKEKKVKVKKLILHPNYLDSLTEGFCDIALIELEQPLKSISPAKINTAFDELNYDVVGVGYGTYGAANKPDLISESTKKIAGENVVDSIGGQEYLGFETLLICDFDHPDRTDCNKIGSPIPRPLEFIGSDGDSGGGLFRENDQKWELIGIYSSSSIDFDQFKKTGYYGQLMEWIRVSPFTEWIMQQIK